MRTTLELDDDVEEKLRRLAESRKQSLRQVVNDTLRAGLSKQEPRRPRRAPYRTPVFESAFRPGVDPMKLNQLVDELEVRDRHDRTRGAT